MRKFVIFVLGGLALSLVFLSAAAALEGRPFPAGLPGYLSAADPLAVVSLWALAFALAAFAAGILSGDYSWVDRLWSTLPVAFSWYYAYRGGFSPAMAAATLLVSVWGLRLSLNFARRGGYSGEEDYRWAILRGRITHPLAWQAFNLGFISLFQVGIFILFTMPLARLARDASPAFGAASLAAFGLGMALMALAIVLETAADGQQWAFQEAKRAFRSGSAAGEAFRADCERGFRSTGLFAYSRHPNYFGELLTWWALYLAVSGLRGSLLDWSLAGPLVLSLLFVGSTKFTEEITARKYPAYRDYQRRVSAVIPWFPRRG